MIYPICLVLKYESLTAGSTNHDSAQQSDAIPQANTAGGDPGTPNPSDQVFTNITAVGHFDVGEWAVVDRPAIGEVRTAVSPPVVSENHAAVGPPVVSEDHTAVDQPVVSEGNVSTSQQATTTRKRARRDIARRRDVVRRLSSTPSATRTAPTNAAIRPTIIIEIDSEDDSSGN